MSFFTILPRRTYLESNASPLPGRLSLRFTCLPQNLQASLLVGLYIVVGGTQTRMIEECLDGREVDPSLNQIVGNRMTELVHRKVLDKLV